VQVIYKKQGATFDASFCASAGVGANLGSTELINEFFTAIDPGIDLSQSGSAADFQKVLSDSLDRSLAISLNAACTAAFADEAAIDSALTGDWAKISQLPNDEGTGEYSRCLPLPVAERGPSCV
jgi:hypothetical protein